MRHGWRLARVGWLCLITTVIISVSIAAPALAGVVGSAHDFRGPAAGGKNTTYPNLAGLAGSSACRVCHEGHPAQEVESLFAEDFGWMPSSRISLPSSGLCMSCHDGQASFGTGQGDTIKDPGKVIAKKHRRHRTEFLYPAAANLLPTPGRVTVDEKGRAFVQGVNGGRLPLYRDPRSGNLKGGCPTCHNPHEPGSNRLFLRTVTVKQLCMICHQA